MTDDDLKGCVIDMCDRYDLERPDADGWLTVERLDWEDLIREVHHTMLKSGVPIEQRAFNAEIQPLSDPEELLDIRFKVRISARTPNKKNWL